MTQLIDVRSTLHESIDGHYIKREQEIPEDFLAHLGAERDYAATHRAGEFHKVASIPVALVETWQREGFDVYHESAKAILARLRRHDLGAFITSTKV
jgi:hypothetical protein